MTDGKGHTARERQRSPVLFFLAAIAAVPPLATDCIWRPGRNLFGYGDLGPGDLDDRVRHAEEVETSVESAASHWRMRLGVSLIRFLGFYLCFVPEHRV
jgi:hypothetical protein